MICFVCIKDGLLFQLFIPMCFWKKICKMRTVDYLFRRWILSITNIIHTNLTETCMFNWKNAFNLIKVCIILLVASRNISFVSRYSFSVDNHFIAAFFWASWWSNWYVEFLSIIDLVLISQHKHSIQRCV